MGRAERRREGKEKAPKTLNMTTESLDRTIKMAREDERKRLSDKVISYYSASIAMVLYDKWGFDHDKLVTVISQIDSMYDSILSNRINFEDLRKTLIDEAKIDIK